MWATLPIHHHIEGFGYYFFVFVVSWMTMLNKNKNYRLELNVTIVSNILTPQTECKSIRRIGIRSCLISSNIAEGVATSLKMPKHALNTIAISTSHCPFLIKAINLELSLVLRAMRRKGSGNDVLE